jgi:hypothetical protein
MWSPGRGGDAQSARPVLDPLPRRRIVLSRRGDGAKAPRSMRNGWRLRCTGTHWPPILAGCWRSAAAGRRLPNRARNRVLRHIWRIERARPGRGRWVIRRPGLPIARLAPSGADSGRTKASALGMRRRHQYILKKPPTGRRPAAGSGAAKASPHQRCRSARTAQPASIGAIPRADSIRSTAATCPWRGGRMPESAPAMRLIRSRSPDRERSGAQRRTRTFAPRACRTVQPSGRRHAETIDAGGARRASGGAVADHRAFVLCDQKL